VHHSFCGSRFTALNGAAQNVYQVTFQGVAPGTVVLDLDQTDDRFAMARLWRQYQHLCRALTDGSVTVFDALAVTGRIDLQGRPNDTGAVMSFGVGSGRVTGRSPSAPRITGATSAPAAWWRIPIRSPSSWPATWM